ncbi:MAG: hypothetical protein V9G15_14335 [Dermatophilaceae bacterium]
MTVVGEGIAIKALEVAATTVARTAAQRLWSEFNPMTRRSKKKVQAILDILASLDFTDRISLLGIVNDLPDGVTLARLERILSSLPTQG